MDNNKVLVSRLRALGLVMNREMNNIIDKDHRQFLVAFMVSSREIEEGSFHAVLNDAEAQFYNILNGPVNASKRYFRLKRLIFLMNFKDQHTEARLLDPTGTILDKLKDDEQEEREDIEITDSDFLNWLKRGFIAERGTNESYTIAMFSYFLPCTQPDHACAKLLKAFAEQTKTNIILSYEMPYMTTDEQMSIDAMRCEKIKLIHPEECDYFRDERPYQPCIGRQYNQDHRPVYGIPPSYYDISWHDQFEGIAGYFGAPRVRVSSEPNSIIYPYIPSNYRHIPTRSGHERPDFRHAFSNRQWRQWL